MDSTFITIHNLSAEANILFASDSIADILGYQPYQVQGRSCFDYFHPDEIPFARYIHERGVSLDKAASLHYARIQSAEGLWIGCECCFTVVHDVLVACTSVYRQSLQSDGRARNAPIVRRLFSSKTDPRYHMLEHLAPKFRQPAPQREPRAALIINRYTRSLAIMFATNSVADILGLTPAELQNKSFYECIQENCLDQAMECLEGAKANDSIAYLRFWSRDARREQDLNHQSLETGNFQNSTFGGPREPFDAGVASGHEHPVGSNGFPNRPSGFQVNHRRSSSDSEPGGVRLDDEDMAMDSPTERRPEAGQDIGHVEGRERPHAIGHDHYARGLGSSQQTSGQASLYNNNHPGDPMSRDARSQHLRDSQPRYPFASVEIEAVVSCTSDGLVVVLRRAHRSTPNAYLSHIAEATAAHPYGTFAAPWASVPIRPQYAFATPARTGHSQHVQPQVSHEGIRGPPLDQLMSSIRDVAVFAWALVGINNTFVDHSHGTPFGNAKPTPEHHHQAGAHQTEPPSHTYPAVIESLTPAPPYEATPTDNSAQSKDAARRSSYTAYGNQRD